MKLEVHVYHHFPNSPAETSRLEEILALLGKLHHQGGKIMSAVSDFAAKVNTAFTDIAEHVDGLKLDVDGLKAQIAALQASQGTLTPEDQALLDGIQAQAEAASAKLHDLDAATETPPAP